MCRLLFIIIFVCAGAIKASAQTGIFELLNREQYLAKVKLIDEFFARFNGEELRNDLGPEYSDRESGVLLLFDIAKYKSKNDSGFVAAKAFAHSAVNSGVKLNFEDKNWFAKIKCHGKLAQKKVTFNVILCVEERDSAMYRWAISDVEGDMFSNSRDKAHEELFIMPNDNEQFFMSIRNITTESYKFIDDYVKSGYKVDALSTFLTLVRSNQLKIDAVTDVEFIFLQVPNYSFTVKYFERQNNNAGWLIDSIRLCDDSEKADILKRLHSVYNTEDTTTSKEIVRRFGNYLSSWCMNGDIDCRSNIEKMCGRACRIDDKIMDYFAHINGLSGNTIDYYLNSFAGLLNDSITFELSDINSVVNGSDLIDTVSCTIKISGQINLCVKDLFYINKKNNKIIKVTNYERQLN